MTNAHQDDQPKSLLYNVRATWKRVYLWFLLGLCVVAIISRGAIELGIWPSFFNVVSLVFLLPFLIWSMYELLLSPRRRVFRQK